MEPDDDTEGDDYVDPYDIRIDVEDVEEEDQDVLDETLR
jgi:hypothetical protein